MKLGIITVEDLHVSIDFRKYSFPVLPLTHLVILWLFWFFLNNFYSLKSIYVYRIPVNTFTTNILILTLPKSIAFTQISSNWKYEHWYLDLITRLVLKLYSCECEWYQLSTILDLGLKVVVLEQKLPNMTYIFEFDLKIVPRSSENHDDNIYKSMVTSFMRVFCHSYNLITNFDRIKQDTGPIFVIVQKLSLRGFLQKSCS